MKLQELTDMLLVAMAKKLDRKNKTNRLGKWEAQMFYRVRNFGKYSIGTANKILGIENKQIAYRFRNKVFIDVVELAKEVELYCRIQGVSYKKPKAFIYYYNKSNKNPFRTSVTTPLTFHRAVDLTVIRTDEVI